MSRLNYRINASKIREARTAQLLTQEEVAHEAGLSVAQISRIESGQHTPRVKSLKKIAAALGLDPHDLIEDASWRQPALV